LLCINRQETDPYFNLAAEEYVLKEIREDTFMLWRSSPCVVIGKHQNAWAEVNPGYIWKSGIPVIRRISGGGTVYDDLGNINFSFTSTGTIGHLVDFQKFTKPVLKFLESIGVNAKFEGKNNLTIDGLKFSGNSEHVFKNKVLHHGSLLFNSNLDNLRETLRPSGSIYTSRAVISMPNQVTNLSDYLPPNFNIEGLIRQLFEFIPGQFINSTIYQFSKQDIIQINKLATDKYMTWEWNFGYSPPYTFRNSFVWNDLAFDITLKVNQGIIQEATIVNIKNGHGLNSLEEILKGSRHEETMIAKRLRSFNFDAHMPGITLGKFVEQLF
jgi:lipoate-protein ligase A